MTWLLTLLVATTIACLPVPALGYNNGCPIACQPNPIPQHPGNSISNAISGEYTIDVMSLDSVSYLVTLKGPPFIGFVINVDGGSLSPSNGDGVKFLDCTDTTNISAAVTQTEPIIRESVTVKWKPTSQEGDYIFTAIAVKNYSSHVKRITVTISLPLKDTGR